jgi:hypothetical protein
VAVMVVGLITVGLMASVPLVSVERLTGSMPKVFCVGSKLTAGSDCACAVKLPASKNRANNRRMRLGILVYNQFTKKQLLTYRYG